MTGWLSGYIFAATHVAFALFITAGCLILTVALGAILYALYKGATDRMWR